MALSLQCLVFYLGLSLEPMLIAAKTKGWLKNEGGPLPPMKKMNNHLGNDFLFLMTKSNTWFWPLFQIQYKQTKPNLHVQIFVVTHPPLG
jgi:hypothetical protein